MTREKASMTHEKVARAVAEGELFGRVDCYVLDDGRRVISQRGMLRALRKTGKSDGSEHGHLGRFLERLPQRFRHLATDPNVEFVRPDGGVSIGREAQFLVQVCAAYASAFSRGELRASQHELGQNAIAILPALASVGIEALVDEATGYQRTRGERELARRFAVTLRHEVGKWEITFPPSLVRALAPLYGHTYTSGAYPRALHCPFGLIYNLIFGRDVAQAMRRRNEAPEAHRHHQWLQPGAHQMLTNELAIVEVLANQSRTREEFWQRMRAHYCGVPLQLGLAAS